MILAIHFAETMFDLRNLPLDPTVPVPSYPPEADQHRLRQLPVGDELFRLEPALGCP